MLLHRKKVKKKLNPNFIDIHIPTLKTLIGQKIILSKIKK